MASADCFASCDEVIIIVVKRSEFKIDSATWALSLITCLLLLR